MASGADGREQTGSVSAVFSSRGASLIQSCAHVLRRIAWADLLKRVFEVEALRFTACGGRTRPLAAITDANVARRILECLALPPPAPSLAHSQGDPGLAFHQLPAEDRDPNEDS